MMMRSHNETTILAITYIAYRLIIGLVLPGYQRNAVMLTQVFFQGFPSLNERAVSQIFMTIFTVR
jgi:hypothetical protein